MKIEKRDWSISLVGTVAILILLMVFENGMPILQTVLLSIVFGFSVMIILKQSL